MTVLSDQFNSDITAMMDDAWGELFTPETGSAFTGQITVFRSDNIDSYPGNASEIVAELRWQASDFAEPIPEFKFLQQSTGKYWVMKESPEVTGGEVIATVYQLKRSRTGAI